MGSTFARVKTWIAGETLTASDLNAEYDNVLDNLDPSGIDDESSSTAEMRATADPYPASVISAPTDLAGEFQRLRYLLVQITGETYWYIDPDSTVAAMAASIAALPSDTIMVGDGGTTKAYFYQNTAPSGWTIDNTPADALLAVKGGSQAYNANGGQQKGTWTQNNHLHTTGDRTLSEDEMPPHTHTVDAKGNQATNSTSYIASGETTYGSFNPSTSATGGGSAHNHGNTGNSATVNTWRPYASLGIICTLDA